MLKKKDFFLILKSSPMSGHVEIIMGYNRIKHKGIFITVKCFQFLYVTQSGILF